MKLRTAWAAVLAACGVLLPAHGQTLEVTPAQVMNDQAAAIRVRGLQPGQHVTLRANMTDGDGQTWAAEAEFAADAGGTVDLGSQAPVKGSYRTVSAMGLVWSMTPTTKDVHMYRMPHDLAPQAIALHLLVDGKETGAAQLEQLAVAAGVRQSKVEGLLRGVYFWPAGEGRHPAVLVLGGSEGGAPLRRAAWLASHGYAALALCYFHCEGRPDSLLRIPLEYFQQALAWMIARPEVDGTRLAVMGVSRGGELALQLGSMFPALKAVVAYVPANVRFPACCGYRPPLAAWTWQGRDLFFARPMIHDPAMQMEAAIRVELTHGAILMIGGEDDGVWPSAEMVTAAAERLHSAHFQHKVVVLKYPHAGHRAGMPEIMPAWNRGMVHPLTGTAMDPGGTPEGNAESTLDAIPKVLGFLKDALDEEAAPAVVTPAVKPAQ